MKLFDAIATRSYKGKPLEDGTWYVRFEMPDALSFIRRQSKMSIVECNTALVEAETAFVNATADFFEAVKSESVDVIAEKDATAWMNEQGEMRITLRYIFKGVDDLNALLEKVKTGLREKEIYLRIRSSQQ